MPTALLVQHPGPMCKWGPFESTGVVPPIMHSFMDESMNRAKNIVL